jgi:hypothetical protein
MQKQREKQKKQQDSRDGVQGQAFLGGMGSITVSDGYGRSFLEIPSNDFWLNPYINQMIQKMQLLLSAESDAKLFPLPWVKGIADAFA